MIGHLELWILGLLAAVAGLVMLSNFFRVPYPVFLALGGLALGFVPAVPELELPPDLVLLIFLPPILYSAALFSSPQDLKANLRPIAFLSIGLVLLTTVTVAVVAHTVIGSRGERPSSWGRSSRRPIRWRRRPSPTVSGCHAGS